MLPGSLTAGAYLLTATGTLPEPGTETAHLALNLVDAAGAKTLLGEGDIIFTDQSSNPPPLSLPVGAASNACGQKLVVTLTHPTGKNPIYFLFIALDVP